MTSKNSYWKISGWYFNNHLGMLVTSLLAWFIAFPAAAIVSTAQSGATYELRQAAETSARLEGYVTMGPVYALISAALAIAFAVTAFCWMNDQEKVDLYRSAPVSDRARFTYIRMNCLLYFEMGLLADLLLTVVIIAARGAMSLAILGCMGMIVLTQSAIFLATFSIAVIAQMMTGNAFLAVLLACLLSGIEYLAEFLCYAYKSVFYKTIYTENMSILDLAQGWLTPLDVFARQYNAYFNSSGITTLDGVVTKQALCCAAVILLQALVYDRIAYLLYKHRPAQTGGKRILFTPARPVLKVVTMVMASLMMAILYALFSSEKGAQLGAVGLAVGLVLSQIILQILLEGSIRAIRRGLRSFAAGAVISLAFYSFFALDLSGYDTYLPDSDALQSVAFTTSEDICYDFYTKDGGYVDSQEYILENASIDDKSFQKTWLAALQTAMDRGQYSDFAQYDDGESCGWMYVKYTLTDGRSVYRCYVLPVDTEEQFYEAAYAIASYKECINELEQPGMDYLLSGKNQNLIFTEYDLNETTHETADAGVIRSIYEACLADYADRTAETVTTQIPVGSLAFESENLAYAVYDETTDLYYDAEGNAVSGDVYITFPVYASDSRTMAVLQDSFGWDPKPHMSAEEVTSVTLYSDSLLQDMGYDYSGISVDPSQWEDILQHTFVYEAVNVPYIRYGMASEYWLDVVTASGEYRMLYVMKDYEQEIEALL